MTALENRSMAFAVGPAGTGKTHSAVGIALSHYRQKAVGKIVICRPAIEAGEALGYLPGTAEEKLRPYLIPIFESIESITKAQNGSTNAAKTITNGPDVEIVAFAHMRGRAQPLTSQIPTPTGYKLMGDLQVGDNVLGSDGKPTKITGIYPQGIKDIYQIWFSDDTIAQCTEDHLWYTLHINNRNRKDGGYKTRPLSEMITTVHSKWHQQNYSIPLISSPANFDHKPVPVDPYLLGLLLGDGCMRSGSSIGFTTADEELVDRIQDLLPVGNKIHHTQSQQKYDYKIIRKPQKKKNGPGSLAWELKALGVYGHLAKDKSIPDSYLFNSPDVRLAVLQGLLDTDGAILKHPSGSDRIQFYSTSPQLAEQVSFIVRSLGGLANLTLKMLTQTPSHKLRNREVIHHNPSFTIDIILPNDINPFRLLRKASKRTGSKTMTRRIKKIMKISTEEAQCISVDAIDHLYLTDQFIVTHNTFSDSFVIVDEAQNATLEQLEMILTRIGLGSKIIVTGDPSQSDLKKGCSGLPIILKLLENNPEIPILQFTEDDNLRHPLVGMLTKIFSEYHRTNR